MTERELEVIVKESLHTIIKNDIYLLDYDVHEQSLSATLACYLKKRVPPRNNGGWDVDVEYNRNLGVPKRLVHHGNVKPDIIIHRRGENNEKGTEDNNLLIIEIKKEPSVDEEKSDVKKIKGFIEEEPYKYKFGLFIGVYRDTPEKFKCTWYERDNI